MKDPMLPRPNLNRRGFLKMLGAVGGTSLVMGAMDAWGMGLASAQDAPPELSGNGDGKRVIILGAGLAGMTAAYELSKLGYDTPIIEARDFAGGRCQTARRGFTLTEITGETQRCMFDEGQFLNHGPWRIPYHHRSTLHYTKEFNVPLMIMVNENDAAWVMYENIEGPLAGRRIRQKEVKADMRGYTAELLAKAVDQGQLELELSEEDKERLVAYLVHEGYLSSEDMAYRGTTGRGYREDPGAGMNPGVPSDPHDFSALLTSRMGHIFRSVNSYTQQSTMFEPVGGMDQIAKGFERAVGRMIHYGQEVKEIRQNGEGVTVAVEDKRTGETREIEGDYCICTIPLSVLQQIPADFSGEFQQAMRQVSYTPTGKVGLQFARRFWEEDDFIYGGHTITDFVGNITYPSYGWQGQKGVVQGYYRSGQVSIEVSAMSPQERIQYALEQGAKVHGDAYMEEFENGFSAFWHLIEYNLGGWASWSGDARREAYPILNEPDGRIYLAGEHLSYLTGWMAGAIESAWIQLERLHERAAQETNARERATS
jgi:monoamine oxidase